MASLFITISIFVVMLFGFNRLMGYRKGNITLELDGRYASLTDQANAVTEELRKQGKSAEYNGDGHYVVDGLSYVVLKRNVGMGGVPLERTVLVPDKK
ncbi:hypothetical protein [Sporosarcina sp. ZBG7A]|uniref:hypothetical protein n=1 Tax=Sporosarcina sp. ZBG7A TaxID=1582223 RepID=UPI00057B03F3|nr:hypothetical protein [Sporosarcina sp. ZBG7A]